MILTIAFVFLTAIIFLDGYHHLMIKKYGYIPLNKLPKIEGIVLAVSQHCLSSKNGVFRPIKIKKHTGDISNFGIECSKRTSDVNIFAGKLISIYYEKWLFPTFMKEQMVAIMINDVDFTNIPAKRTIEQTPVNLTAWDYLNAFKLRVAFAVFLIFVFIFVAKNYAKKTVKNYKQIRLLKSQAKAKFKKSTQGFFVKIINEELQFTTDNKYVGAVLTLNIYYMKNNETFWHFFFHSDGLISRTSHIPNNIAKIKWPNLALTM